MIQLSKTLAAMLTSCHYDPAQVTADLDALYHAFYPKHERLLNTRTQGQLAAHTWLTKETQQAPYAADRFADYLHSSGYAQRPSSAPCICEQSITTIAPELYPQSGPQLVVPADKANMVLNAANARFGSLYNALYASNIIDPNITESHARRAGVKAYCADLLDTLLPLDGMHWKQVTSLSIAPPASTAPSITLSAYDADERSASLSDQASSTIKGILMPESSSPSSAIIEGIIFTHHGLDIILMLNGRGEIEDIILESVLSYIVDLEDASVSASENKCESYRILDGLLKGTLTCEIRGTTRSLATPKNYYDHDGQAQILPQQAQPLVREVGMHMLADADLICLDDGSPIPEYFLDRYLTSLFGYRYHVCPKLHGAEEVALTVEMFSMINQLLGLPDHANRIGVMNEEMRTTLQLESAIEASQDCIFFINTGFLDYTGSFIDLMSPVGPIAPYTDLVSKEYMKAYERNNVATGLRTHIPQIGAGMWPKTKDMKGLLDSKRSQIKQGTDTSWSPSPSAAVIHALAFMTSPPSRAIQSALRDEAGSLTQLEFSVAPYVDFPHLAHDIDDKAINDHLNNAVHGLISYAHPWVRHGIGCSAIADMNGVLLMEDRATARIKAAFIRNWLAHDVVTTDAVVKSIIAMAAHVDLHLQTLNPEHQPIVTQALHEHDWGQCDPILQAVHDVIFNPKNEVFSYVETYFYPAHRAVLSASRPTKPL